jgi:hypothetical protein
MKKRILTLGIMLALVAGMAIPAAVIAQDNDTDVTGSIVVATIEIETPADIGLGMLTWGDNAGNSTGSVTVTANSWDPTNVPWQVTAIDEKVTNTGYMLDGVNPLQSGKLLISPDGNDYVDADTEIMWNGQGSGEHDIDFYVNQVIDEYEDAGNYSITITFTAEITI